VTDILDDVLVLWGQGFDEITASIFVVELRRAGIRVKLMGLNSRQIAGQHGLALVPDLTLGQALRRANRTRCLILPAPVAAIKQFSYDPRLAELLGLAASNQALLVMDSLPTHDLLLSNPLLQSFPNVLANVLAYPSFEELVSFVQFVLSPRLKISN
jgi:hypothetical protein